MILVRDIRQKARAFFSFHSFIHSFILGLQVGVTPPKKCIHCKALDGWFDYCTFILKILPAKYHIEHKYMRIWTTESFVSIKSNIHSSMCSSCYPENW